MDSQAQFHIAYRMAAHDHRIAALERAQDRFKRTALRITFFLVLWGTAILANSTSGDLSTFLSTAAKGVSLML